MNFIGHMLSPWQAALDQGFPVGGVHFLGTALQFQTLRNSAFSLSNQVVDWHGSLQALPTFSGYLFFFLHRSSFQYIFCMSVPVLVSAFWKTPTKTQITSGLFSHYSRPNLQTPLNCLDILSLPSLYFLSPKPSSLSSAPAELMADL